MKINWKKADLLLAVTVAVLALLLLSVSGCSGGGTGTTTSPGATSSGRLPVSLSEIQLSPANASIAAGTTQQFSVTGLFKGKSKDDMTVECEFESSNDDIATIDRTGLARGVKPGNCVIIARDSKTRKTASTNLNVTDAKLLTLQVTKSGATIANGATSQYTATGIFTDNSTQDLTTSVIWSSTDYQVATVSNKSGLHGLACGISLGKAVIKARDLETKIEGSCDADVTGKILTQIKLFPNNTIIANGTTQLFSAVGYYNDNTTKNLTKAVDWTSSNPGVVSISNSAGSEGLATANTAGAVTVTAQITGSNISGTTTLNVVDLALTSITVTPDAPSIAEGTKQQFTAIGNYNNGMTQVLTNVVTWSSNNPTAATISNAAGSAGLAQAVQAGAATITATDPITGISSNTQLSVQAKALTNIAITPKNRNIANGASVQLTATGYYNDGSKQNLTDQLAWISSDTNIISVSNAAGQEGWCDSAANGTAVITAKLGLDYICTTNITVSTPYDGWHWQNPYPQGSGIWGVSFVDANNGWAVTEAANIIHTADGGATWNIQKSSYDLGINGDLFGVKFVDLNEGWAVGEGAVILHTIDGGVTWAAQNPNIVIDPNMDNILQAVAFHPDKLHGCIVGDTGNIRYTSDGGATWNVAAITDQLPANIANFYLMGVCFADPVNNPQLLFASGGTINNIATGEPEGQIILKSTDSGATWTTVFDSGNPADPGLWGISFMDADNGVVSGDGGTILITSDGGANWTHQGNQVNPNVPDVILPAPQYVDANNIWIGGEFYVPNPNGPATIMHYDGTNWTNVLANTTIADDFLAISFIDGNHGWCVGTLGAILYTADGGVNWTSQRQGASELIYEANFVDQYKGYGIGLAGLVVYTPDGGNSWMELDNPAIVPAIDLTCVNFVDANQGWVGGVGGYLMHTDDGGATWAQQALPIGLAQDINAVSFVDSMNGYVFGAGGMVCKTTDGGVTWVDLSANTGTDKMLNAGVFKDINNGWAVGEGGVIIFTSNGGATWTQLAGKPNVPYYSVKFNGENGIITGKGGTILYTNNGGGSWQQGVVVNAAGLLSNVFESGAFANAATGYAVSVGGDILKTTDGGATWNSQYYMTPNPLYDVYCLNDTSVWIIGDGGTMLTTYNGGF